MMQAKRRKKWKKIEATKEGKGCPEMSDNSRDNYYEDDENYYDDLAEAWDERSGYERSGSGGGSSGSKKKAKPTTVGKRRVGGAQAWGSSDKVCPNSCTKKCCSGATNSTPAM